MEGFLICSCCCSVSKSCPTLCNPTPAACQSPLSFISPGVSSNSCLLSQWCHPTISSSVVAFSSCLQSFPASRSFQMSQFFTSGAKVLELHLQHESFQWKFRVDFLQDWLIWSPCARNSRESSPTPQFKRINSWVLSLLYGPPLTSLHDYWKKRSFDYKHLRFYKNERIDC